MILVYDSTPFDYLEENLTSSVLLKLIVCAKLLFHIF